MENKSEELTLAKSLWDEIRQSLELCGDIGEFSPSDFALEDLPRVVWQGKPVLPFPVLRRLTELDGQINEIFWNVYEALGICAGSKLGLDEKLSIAFADSLAIIRTGMAGGHHTEAEQCIAQEIFLSRVPFGSNWNPASPIVQGQLREVFERFKRWQGDSELYGKDIKQFWEERR